MPALTDAQQRVAELTTLNELAQTLNRALDLREALDAALPKIVEIMGLRTGWIFLRDETGTFKLAARHELPPAILYPGPAWSNGSGLDKREGQHPRRRPGSTDGPATQ